MLSQKNIYRTFIASLVLTLGCARQLAGPKANAITPYCGTPQSISGPSITVSGTAKFENLTLDNCTAAGVSCPILITQKPIRYAEIRVTGSASALAQCGETDASGNFSLQLPKSTGAYSIHVASRSNNSNLEAYVLDNNIDNKFYTLDLSVDSDSNQSGLAMLAPSGSATSRIAGAFSILDNLLLANIFLRSNTAFAQTTSAGLPVGGCSNGSYFPNCQSFSVGPLAYAYWSKGVNPGSGTSGVSFYVPGTSSLYILGGLDGVVDGEDSDEFDPSVIIHEYGHFLEEHYGRSDSPGGSHNGNSIIDPRLAWSEGWADFFQAAVRGSNTYADIRNYTTGYGYYEIYEYLSTVVGPPSQSPSMDHPTSAGEGTFREFSVTRALFAILKTTSFSEIWSVFSGDGSITTAGTTNGFHSTDYHFRNVSLLHRIHGLDRASATSQPFTDWTTEQSAEDQSADLSSYGAPLATASAPCSALHVLNPAEQFNIHAGDAFYDFVPSYSGNQSITLTYLVPHSQQIDVDLYVYQENYSYYCTYTTCSSWSNVVRKGVVAANTDTESFSTASGADCTAAGITSGCANYDRATVTLSANLGAGRHYLVNPSAYTFAQHNTTPQVYLTLSINGQNQCPQL